MRFISPRDYATLVQINKELITDVIDTTVIVYKLNIAVTKTNSYGEATKKTWNAPVEVPCLIKRDEKRGSEALQTVDVQQNSEFAFLRADLEARGLYPEVGDIIAFDAQYYEINLRNEVQLWGGRTEYKHSIVCQAHLTRKTNLQLELPTV